MQMLICPMWVLLLYVTSNINTPSQILDDQQSPAETESTLVPEATVPVSTEIGPIVAHPPTRDMPELSVKPTMKRRVYVLVPPAPYALPHHSNRRNQANSSTSVPLVTQDEPQSTVNRPEQEVPPSQVDDKVPKTLSDIGISIPTTVRKPGSFIIHTLPHITTQSTEHLMKSVIPRAKTPHVGNPVTTQVITKGSISTLKFKKSKVKSTPSSSNNNNNNNDNNTTVVASTDIQGGPKSPKLAQLLPKPPLPLPDVSNDVTELAAQSIANKVMDRVDFMLVSNHF